MPKGPAFRNLIKQVDVISSAVCDNSHMCIVRNIDLFMNIIVGWRKTAFLPTGLLSRKLSKAISVQNCDFGEHSTKGTLKTFCGRNILI